MVEMTMEMMTRATSVLRGRGPCQRAQRACARSETTSLERVSSPKARD